MYNNVGIIGRFRPLHKGHVLLLKTLCEQSNYVLIGIGASNKYNYLNPFTPSEVRDMITLSLYNFSNYDILEVPDYGHLPEYNNGDKWTGEVVIQFCNIDLFVTGNEYVKELLRPYFTIKTPQEIIKQPIAISSTLVRLNIAMNQSWLQYVTDEIQDYIVDNKIDERIRKEFGKEIIKYCNLEYDSKTEKGKII